MRHFSWFACVLTISVFLTTSATAQTGQSPQPGLAVFDVTVTQPTGASASALNWMSMPVASAAPGPYFANASSPSSIAPAPTVTFTFSAASWTPILFLAGPANTGVAIYPGVGQLDIGLAPLVSGIPQALVLVADGTTAGSFWDALFITDITGQTSISFVAPPIPPGIIRFQCVFNGGGLFHISNAVDVLF